MCSTAGDIEDITNCSREILNKINKESLQKCKKCGEKSCMLLQKKDPFCKPCFYEYCDHKFRSTIGKSKKIKHGEKVLLACSGGRKSAALLHMTNKTLKSASLKQITFLPGILFIDDTFLTCDISTDAQPNISCLLKEMKKSEYTVLFSSLEMVYKVNSGEDLFSLVPDDFTSDIFLANTELKSKMKENFNDISLSSKVDLLNHLRLLLITEIAHQAKYDSIFVGDTASALAVELLSNIALGRGSQISSNTNFYDTRYKVPVCRPLREFLNEEIALYNHAHSISYEIVSDFLTKTSSNSCVQRLTETFLLNLQESFPATIFTVFRTGGKLSRTDVDSDNTTCIICKSELVNRISDPYSALEALKTSEKLTEGPSKASENASTSGEFIFVEYLCHACSTTFKNMPKEEHYYSLIPKVSCLKMKRSKMKEDIQEFLLDDDNHY